MIDQRPSENSELSLSNIARFKCAPITWVDVERSFSRHQNNLRPDRRHLKFDCLKKIITVFTATYSLSED